MSDKVKAVEYVSEVRQVKTLSDHTTNVTLNFPEYCSAQAAWFLQHHGEIIKSISVLQGLTDGTNETERRSTSDPLGVDRG